MSNTHNNPIIQFDGETAAYLPETFNLMDGNGEINVRTETTGGGRTNVIFSADQTTRIGGVDLTLANTPESVALKERLLQTMRDGNFFRVTISAPQTNFNKAIENCQIVNNITSTFGTDASFDLEIRGNPVDDA